MRRGLLAPALAAAALLATLIAGCGRPDDETWLQFLGFQDTGKTIAVLEGKLDISTDSADAVFQNTSFLVGSNVSGGSGVLVHRAHVEYRMPDLQPPASEYALNLYLPAPSHTSSTTTSGTTGAVTGTISDFPLAPASLKSWIIGTGVYNSRPSVSLQAQVTFYAETDEGTDLETQGGISIVLTK
jgi:hypothetical protein